MTNVDEEGHLYGVNGGSGGYAETIFRHAAKVLFGKEIEGPLNFRTIRNSDFREVALEVSIFSNCFFLSFFHSFSFPYLPRELWSLTFYELSQVDGKTVLKFALCYGFRNLQNVVRKIKLGKCDYHFLEIMACPSGIYSLLSIFS